MMHRAWSSIVEVPYSFSSSYVKFQGHTALKIVEFDPNWAFPDSNSSLNSPMAMKCCTKLETAKARCPIVFQGHPSNFKVTGDKTSPILTQIGRFRTIGRSQLSNPSDLPCLTHWGRVTNICISKLTIIGFDNGLSTDRRQAIIWTNAGMLLIGPLGTNFSEISIEIHIFSFKEMHLKMLSGNWQPSCLGLSVLTPLSMYALYANMTLWCLAAYLLIYLDCFQIPVQVLHYDW